ncbi:MAG: YciI family protein [Acidimicrobiia bacterium]
MPLYVFKLIPPRPTFVQDMSETESEIMDRHFSYWEAILESGQAVVYGPVADPSGTWGLGVIEVENEEEARALAIGDPAVDSGMATFDLHPMPMGIARRQH